MLTPCQISGFYFSTEEPTALVQTEGGPCAVIAPVQAFILKQLLLESQPDVWASVDTDKQDRLLARAAIEIISQSANATEATYRIVYADESANRSEALDSHPPANLMENSQVQQDSDVSTPDPSNVEQHSDAKLSPENVQPALDSESFHSRLRFFLTGF